MCWCCPTRLDMNIIEIIKLKKIFLISVLKCPLLSSFDFKTRFLNAQIHICTHTNISQYRRESSPGRQPIGRRYMHVIRNGHQVFISFLYFPHVVEPKLFSFRPDPIFSMGLIPTWEHTLGQPELLLSNEHSEGTRSSVLPPLDTL